MKQSGFDFLNNAKTLMVASSLSMLLLLGVLLLGILTGKLQPSWLYASLENQQEELEVDWIDLPAFASMKEVFFPYESPEDLEAYRLQESPTSFWLGDYNKDLLRLTEENLQRQFYPEKFAEEEQPEQEETSAEQNEVPSSDEETPETQDVPEEQDADEEQAPQDPEPEVSAEDEDQEAADGMTEDAEEVDEQEESASEEEASEASQETDASEPSGEDTQQEASQETEGDEAETPEETPVIQEEPVQPTEEIPESAPEEQGEAVEAEQASADEVSFWEKARRIWLVILSGDWWGGATAQVIEGQEDAPEESSLEEADDQAPEAPAAPEEAPEEGVQEANSVEEGESAQDTESSPGSEGEGEIEETVQEEQPIQEDLTEEVAPEETETEQQASETEEPVADEEQGAEEDERAVEDESVQPTDEEGGSETEELPADETPIVETPVSEEPAPADPVEEVGVEEEPTRSQEPLAPWPPVEGLEVILESEDVAEEAADQEELAQEEPAELSLDEQFAQLETEYFEFEDQMMALRQDVLVNPTDALALVGKDASLELQVMSPSGDHGMGFGADEAYGVVAQQGMVHMVRQDGVLVVSYYYDQENRTLKEWIVLEEAVEGTLQFQRKLQNHDQYQVRYTEEGEMLFWKNDLEDVRPFVLSQPSVRLPEKTLAQADVMNQYFDGVLTTLFTPGEEAEYPLLIEREWRMPIAYDFDLVEESELLAQLDYVSNIPQPFVENLGQEDREARYLHYQHYSTYFFHDRELVGSWYVPYVEGSDQVVLRDLPDFEEEQIPQDEETELPESQVDGEEISLEGTPEQEQETEEQEPEEQALENLSGSDSEDENGDSILEENEEGSDDADEPQEPQEDADAEELLETLSDERQEERESSTGVEEAPLVCEDDSEGLISQLLRPLQDEGQYAFGSLRQQFVGAQRDLSPRAEEPTEAYFRNVRGAERDGWYRDMMSSQELIYEDLYEGIDLRLLSHPVGPQQLYQIDPSAELDDLVIRFRGVREQSVTERGHLQLDLGVCHLVYQRPYAYFEDANGGHQLVPAKYALEGPRTASFEVNLEEREELLSLVMTLHEDLSTCLPTVEKETSMALLQDAEENLIILGNVASRVDFPIDNNAYQCRSAADFDPVVSKYSVENRELIYHTVFGGSDEDRIESVVLRQVGAFDEEGLIEIFVDPNAPEEGEEVEISEEPSGLDSEADETEEASEEAEEETEQDEEGLEASQQAGALDLLGLMGDETSKSLLIKGFTRSADFPVLNWITDDLAEEKVEFEIEVDVWGRLLIDGNNIFDGADVIAEQDSPSVSVDRLQDREQDQEDQEELSEEEGLEEDDQEADEEGLEGEDEIFSEGVLRGAADEEGSATEEAQEETEDLSLEDQEGLSLEEELEEEPEVREIRLTEVFVDRLDEIILNPNPERYRVDYVPLDELGDLVEMRFREKDSGSLKASVTVNLRSILELVAAEEGVSFAPIAEEAIPVEPLYGAAEETE